MLASLVQFLVVGLIYQLNDRGTIKGERKLFRLLQKKIWNFYLFILVVIISIHPPPHHYHRLIFIP